MPSLPVSEFWAAALTERAALRLFSPHFFSSRHRLLHRGPAHSARAVQRRCQKSVCSCSGSLGSGAARLLPCCSSPAAEGRPPPAAEGRPGKRGPALIGRDRPRPGPRAGNSTWLGHRASKLRLRWRHCFPTCGRRRRRRRGRDGGLVAWLSAMTLRRGEAAPPAMAADTGAGVIWGFQDARRCCGR